MRTVDDPLLWSAEVEFAHAKLLEDPRNNSAWSQRWFARHEGRDAGTPALAPTRATVLPLAVAREEVRYALSGAGVDPHNESPWRYLLGVVLEQVRWARREGDAEEATARRDLLRDAIARTRDLRRSLEEGTAGEDGVPPAAAVAAVPCVSLTSALVDLLEALADDDDGDGGLAEAEGLCAELARADPVRRKYWRRRGREAAARREERRRKGEGAVAKTEEEEAAP